MSLRRALRVSVLGGGNGASVVLRGLARRVRAGEAIEVSAIVATADDGGSSGRLRAQRGGLPPGALRSCLLALAADDGRPFVEVFAHRYGGDGDLGGHALGNLILAALAEREGDYCRGVQIAGEMLGVCGRVLPATATEVHLEASCRDGGRLSGETTIGRANAIERVWLEPADAPACDGVEDAIRGADLVVIGPGSLFTSLLPILLVRGIASALAARRGRCVLVGNLMTQPGETLGMSLEDHLEAIDRHAGAGLVDDVLLHVGPVEDARLAPYREQGAERLMRQPEPLRRERFVSGSLLCASGKIRHDPSKLADALLALAAAPLEAAG